MRNAAEAYGKVAQQAATGRELEAMVLLKAALKLQHAREAWSGELDAVLDEALTHNRKLWTVLATAATEADNPLPQQIKENIANLALFVFKRTIDVMAEPAPEKLDALVRINREIAAGLRTMPQTQAPPQQPA